MLRSDLSDYSDLYNVIKGRINFTGTGAANRRNKKLVFKNNALFRSCISQINTFIDNTEDLDIVIPMYNLSEYTDNYSMASGSLWSYYRDEVNDDANEKNDVGNYRINNSKTTTSRSFEYKTKITGSTPADNSIVDLLCCCFVVPLACLSNLRRFLDLPLTNCETELDLSWTRNCMISEISRTLEVPANPNANLPTDHVLPTTTASATCSIRYCIYKQ